MTDTSHHDERIAKMSFASIYPHYIQKVEKKGRTKDELHQVITWLTGYSLKELESMIADKTNFEDFFKQAHLNPNARYIKGVICGYRVEEITNDITRNVRYLDKLVEELARGRKIDKILRSSPEAAKK